MIVKKLALPLTVALIHLSSCESSSVEREDKSGHFLRAPIFNHVEKLSKLQDKGFFEHGEFVANKIVGAVQAAKKGAEYFRQELNDTKERMKSKREALKARLAAYEEGGSDEFNFSLSCVKKTPQGADMCAPADKHAECTWCTVQDVFGFCTAVEDAELLSEFGITCGDSSEIYTEKHENEIKNNYSLQCLEAASSNNCKEAKDEDGNVCLWCQYNSWIGMCISPDDKDTAENDLFMSCGATSIE